MTQTIGTMRRLDDTVGVVRMEDVYDTDIADLWSAITEPSRLSRWMADVDGDPKLGVEVQAKFTSSWEGPVRVDVCEAPNRLVVTMNPNSDEEGVIEAWLTAEADKTRLIVEERGLPLDVIHYHGAGWQAHLEDLRRYLAGGGSEWKKRWDELTPTYAEMTVA